ncbi:MAG: TOBE domain-containing protein, partial [Deltaproteobacteria bacterium]|nr:TOBE domain-containing protein [Deltaproteobacteria bacterium]
VARAELSHPKGRRGALALRPERVRVESSQDAAGTNRFSGVVEDRLFLGGATVYRVRLEGGAVLEASLPNAAGPPRLGPGVPVQLSWGEDAVRFLVD